MVLKTIWTERKLFYELKQVHFNSLQLVVSRPIAALKFFPHVR